MKRAYEQIAERRASERLWTIIPLAGCYFEPQYEVHDSNGNKLTCGYVGKDRAYIAGCESLGIEPYPRAKLPTVCSLP